MGSAERTGPALRRRKVGVVDVPAGAKVPVTDRGRRTRARLVDAARRVFEESGFLEARITDIADAAGVAYGTFYTYFSTKEAIFHEVARAVQREFLEPHPEAADAGDDLDLYARIERANRRYLEGYAHNARLMAVIEQVATFNPELLAIRREMRVAFVDRSTRAMERWQAEGIMDDELDARYAANALGSMIDRFAYVWLVLGGEFELDAAVHNLTRLWVHALQLQVTAPPLAPAQRGTRRPTSSTRRSTSPRPEGSPRR